ncbi:MAG: 2-succinyl-6-hydroxy-2,4-cyclohexadiene-1-carboxylate synthase [Gemmatimonadales bacterium]|nr:MAG: 2-succinyl-6-hydroxy-2,4-cyclohexadiene-1-carboxylate synthase [Gemmatimonadales bacterium]
MVHPGRQRRREPAPHPVDAAPPPAPGRHLPGQLHPDRHPPSDRRILTLGFRRWGSGSAPPVLLLHGFTGSSGSWPPPIVDALARRGPVLAVDLPGHGGTPSLPSVAAPSSPVSSVAVPPASAPASGFTSVLDAVVRLLDQEGIAAADWIGYSMGGRIALAGAVTHPHRVRRLVLESASPGLDTPRARELRRTRDETLARRLEERGIASFVDFWMELALFASQKRLPEPVQSGARAARLRQDAHALAQALRTMGTGTQPSYWPQLPRLDLPVLLLTGGLDRKFEELANRMADALSRARRHSVPDVGHAVHLEAPGAWISAVSAFLDDPGHSGS